MPLTQKIICFGKLGGGEVSISSDPWILPRPSLQYLMIYDEAIVSDWKVKELIDIKTQTWKWESSDSNLPQCTQVILQHYLPPGPLMEGGLIWTVYFSLIWCQDRLQGCPSLGKYWKPSPAECMGWSTQNGSHLGFRSFLMKVLHGRLPTRVRLHHMGAIIQEACSLCDSCEPEAKDHAILQCCSGGMELLLVLLNSSREN